MTPSVLELEGTWEEVAAHAPELAGRRVRLTVLAPPGAGQSTARSLLKLAGTWTGGDLAECLDLAYATRSPVDFSASAFDQTPE